MQRKDAARAQHRQGVSDDLKTIQFRYVLKAAEVQCQFRQIGPGNGLGLNGRSLLSPGRLVVRNMATGEGRIRARLSVKGGRSLLRGLLQHSAFFSVLVFLHPLLVPRTSPVAARVSLPLRTALGLIAH